MAKEDRGESVLEQLRSIQRLAQQATNEGERANAQSALEKLLAKHKLKLEDLTEEKQVWIWLRAKTKMEKRLLFQIVHKVLNASNINVTKEGRKFWFRVTPLQGADIKVLYKHYLDLFRKELRTLELAFIHKHHLHSEHDPDEEPRPSTLTPEEIYRIMQMMEGLKVSPDPRHRHLPSGNGNDLE